MLLLSLASSKAAFCQVWQVQTPRETHTIPSATGALIPFPLINLPGGMNYSIHSTGTSITNSQGTDFCDAHYYYSNAFPLPLPSGSVRTGLQVKYDGVSLDYVQNRSALAPNAGHNYKDQLPSFGFPLAFRFFDTQEPPDIHYADNKNDITVEVSQGTPQLAVKDSILDFGNVDFRWPKTLLDSIESYGTLDFIVDSVAITGSTAFTIAKAQRGKGIFILSEMATNEFDVTFTPVTLGPAKATLHVYAHNAYFPIDRDRRITLLGVGHGPIIQVVPPSKVDDTTHFGFVKLNATRQRSVRVVNTGDRDSRISSIGFNPVAPFSSVDLQTLIAGDTTGVLVTFIPPMVQHYKATGTFALDTTWKQLDFYVDGDGIFGTVTLTPDTLNFGTLVLKDTKTLSARLINNGAVAVDIGNVTVTGDAAFSASGNQHYTLDTNTTQSYAATFSPMVLAPGGLHTGLMSITFPDGRAPKSVVLIGRDKAPIHGHLAIGRYYFGRVGSIVTITQMLTSSMDSALSPVAQFRESILYNANVLHLLGVANGTLLPQPDWSVAATSLVRGQIDIQATTNGITLHGPGELLRITFIVDSFAKVWDTSAFIQTNLIIGNGLEPLMTTDDGLFHVSDHCTPVFVTGTHVGNMIQQNSPNPAAMSTVIWYDVAESDAQESHVAVRLYDPLGVCVQTFVDQDQPPGSYEIQLSTAELPNGLYTYVYDCGNTHKVKRLVVAH